MTEVCPAGSCPATMEAAVHSPPEGHVAHACQAMAGPSVSTAAMKVARPSPAAMEACAQRRPASHSFTASVPVAGLENAVTRALLSSKFLLAHWRTVVARTTTVCVIESVTRLLVAGTVATAL